MVISLDSFKPHKKPISSIHPVIERCPVFLRRFKRRMKRYFGGEHYALKFSEETLPGTVISHQQFPE